MSSPDSELRVRGGPWSERPRPDPPPPPPDAAALVQLCAVLAQQGAVLADLLRGSEAQREEQAAQRKEQAAQRAVLADLLQGQAAQRQEQAALGEKQAALGEKQLRLLQQILDRLTLRAPAAERAAAAATDALNTAVIGARSTSGSDGEVEGAAGAVLTGLSAASSVRSA